MVDAQSLTHVLTAYLASLDAEVAALVAQAEALEQQARAPLPAVPWPLTPDPELTDALETTRAALAEWQDKAARLEQVGLRLSDELRAAQTQAQTEREALAQQLADVSELRDDLQRRSAQDREHNLSKIEGLTRRLADTEAALTAARAEATERARTLEQLTQRLAEADTALAHQIALTVAAEAQRTAPATPDNTVAEAEAERLIADAQSTAEALVSKAQATAEAINRASLAAGKQTQKILAEAENRAQAIVAQAETRAQTIIADAQAKADSLVAEAAPPDSVSNWPTQPPAEAPVPATPPSARQPAKLTDIFKRGSK